MFSLTDLVKNKSYVMSNRILFGNINNIDDFIIFSSSTPYIDVKEIVGIVEDFIIEEGTYTKEFRWGGDGITFSQWLTLSLENLQNYIILENFPKLWVEFKYTLVSEGEIGLNYINLNVIYNEEPQDSYPFPIAYPKDKGNLHWPIRMRAFSWNPYNQEKTIKLQKDISLLVNQIHGHEVTYFRAVPVPESRDVIFLEWTLQNVKDDPKCIKVVVPENTFPEHKLNHNAFGLDFEMPFEVHIDKRYFEWVFGHNTKPQKNDIIYFPLTNRMYEVESSTISVQFMYDFLYWQLNLVKWQPKRNVLVRDDIQDLLEEYSTGIEKMFGKEIENINKDITNPQQLIDKSSKFDPIRNYISSYNISIQESFINYYTIIFQYYYDLNKHYLAVNGLPEKAIGYNIKGDFSKTDNIAFTCWFRKPVSNAIPKEVLSLDVNQTTIKISFKYSSPKVKIGDILGLSDQNVADFGIFGVVTNINTTNRINPDITIEVDSSMITTANATFLDWKTSTDLKAVSTPRNNFIYSFNETTNKGLIIDMYDLRYIRFQLNENIVWMPFGVKLQENTWYAIVVNILNTFNQLSYHIYKPHPATEKTTKLKLITDQIINGVPDIDRKSGVDYQLLSSPLHIANIRLLSESLEGDLHSKFLSMQIITDAAKALIIDNATPRMKLPYIGHPK